MCAIPSPVDADPQTARSGLAASRTTTVRHSPALLTDRSDYEESDFFPALEHHLGEGFQQKNVEQHAGFHPALEDFNALLAEMRAGSKPFDGAEISRRVQAFGPGLVTHLSEEIDTLHLNTLKEHVPLDEARRIYKMQEDHIKASVGLVRQLRPRELTLTDH